jgi:hypothetical protein
MKGNSTIYLVSVTTEQNEETGKREKSIESIKKVQGQKMRVGNKVFWNAGAQNVKLDATFIVRAKMFYNQKFVFSNSVLYEIYNATNTEDDSNTRLNVFVSDNTEVKELIEEELSEEEIEEIIEDALEPI